MGVTFSEIYFFIEEVLSQLPQVKTWSKFLIKTLEFKIGGALKLFTLDNKKFRMTQVDLVLVWLFDLQCKWNDWFLYGMQHWAEMG